jgi:hypothetical protein
MYGVIEAVCVVRWNLRNPTSCDIRHAAFLLGCAERWCNQFAKISVTRA